MAELASGRQGRIAVAAAALGIRPPVLVGLARRLAVALVLLMVGAGCSSDRAARRRPRWLAWVHRCGNGVQPPRIMRKAL